MDRKEDFFYCQNGTLSNFLRYLLTTYSTSTKYVKLRNAKTAAAAVAAKKKNLVVVNSRSTFLK